MQALSQDFFSGGFLILYLNILGGELLTVVVINRFIIIISKYIK